MRKTIIDLTKMNEASRILYLQDLLEDANKAFLDLTNNEVQYGYLKHILDHTAQAAIDLQQLINAEKTK